MSVRSWAVRSFLGGAGLALSALTFSACSSTSERSVAVPTTAVADSPAPVPAAGSSTTTVVVPEAATPAPPPAAVDGAAVLAASVAGLAGGYHFTSTVSVDGAQTLVADGDRMGDSTRLNLSGEGGNVAYVITPGGSWVLPEGGEWAVLDTAPAATDPIVSLQAPAAVTVLGSDGTTVTLLATVSAAALGIAADGTADVQVVVSGGVLQQIGYSSALADGRTATVVSVVGPLVDTTPIVAPI